MKNSQNILVVKVIAYELYIKKEKIIMFIYITKIMY